MNTKTGDIFPTDDLAELKKDLILMELPPTAEQLKRKPVNPDAIGRVGRNDPCPCGSGRKYKKCHLKNNGCDN